MGMCMHAFAWHVCVFVCVRPVVSCTGWVMQSHTISMPRGRAIREQRGTQLREELGTNRNDDDKDTDRDREQRGALTHP